MNNLRSLTVNLSRVSLVLDLLVSDTVPDFNIGP
jgi:hypothetical protein